MNSNINIYLGVWLQSLPASLLSVKEQSFSRWEPSPPARNIVSLSWKRILLSLAINRLSLLILTVLLFWKKVSSKALSGWTSRPHRCGFSHCWSVAVHRGRSTQSTSVNPIQGGGVPNQPPLSRICVYACRYVYTGANFLWLFLIFSMKEVTRLSTQ